MAADGKDVVKCAVYFTFFLYNFPPPPLPPELSRIDDEKLKSPREKLTCILNTISILSSILLMHVVQGRHIRWEKIVNPMRVIKSI